MDWTTRLNLCPFYFLSNSKLTLNREAKLCGQSTFVHIPYTLYRQLYLWLKALNCGPPIRGLGSGNVFIFPYERSLNVKITGIGSNLILRGPNL